MFNDNFGSAIRTPLYVMIFSVALVVASSLSECSHTLEIDGEKTVWLENGLNEKFNLIQDDSRHSMHLHVDVVTSFALSGVICASDVDLNQPNKEEREGERDEHKYICSLKCQNCTWCSFTSFSDWWCHFCLYTNLTLKPAAVIVVIRSDHPNICDKKTKELEIKYDSKTSKRCADLLRLSGWS